MPLFNHQSFRQEFPLIVNSGFGNSTKEKQMLVYFDNAATTQKPQCVIDCYQQYYSMFNANVHRGSHALGMKATTAFEQSRKKVKAFINARSQKEIIWTKGTTESINLVAQSLASYFLKEGDEIVLSESEHHANIVPWQIAAEKTGAVIKILTLDQQGRIDIEQLNSVISAKVKIVCCTHVSNVIGKINPIDKIILRAKEVGALSFVDGAQAVAHIPVDVQALDCDFYAFSAHKMYGPTGVGVLYGKQALLENMPPYQSGGEMIKMVSFNQTTVFNGLPFKFEAGTPNISGVVAFSQAIKFIQKSNYDDIHNIEKELTKYFYQALSTLSNIHFITEGIPDIPVLSFIISSHHNHDIASALDSYGISIRSGHHCAMPLMEYLKLDGCLRVSLSAYNTKKEIDYFIDSLKQILNEELAVVIKDKQSNKTIPICYTSDDIKAKFINIKGWDSRHREIMLLGKELPRLDKVFRNEQSLIQGCESLAWLIVEKNEQDVFYFQSDSDAKIIRGLLVLILAAFNNKTAQQIKGFDIESYFNSLGLIQHLSPSRGNGVLAIVDKIKKLAQK